MASETKCADCFDVAYLQKHLESFAKDSKISNPKYRIDIGTKKGDNFVGIVYRVAIDGEKNGEKVKMSLIFKCPPENEEQRELLQCPRLYGREAFFYLQVVPIFSELLQENGLTLNDIPVCYAASADKNEEVIILEDLRERGFVMRDRIKGLDYPHASLAIRHLGRLHAYSFALRDQKPEVFRKLTEMQEPFFISDLPREGPFEEYTRILGDHVKVALAEEKPHYLARFIAFYEVWRDEMERCCNGQLAEPYAVVNHGDFWTNNMLFRYDKSSSEPQDFCYLDFQISRYASPALDLQYLLFCCCNQELRSNHYDQLILDYHNSLSECLVGLGSDPKRLFPFVALTDQLKNFGKFAAGLAMIVIRVFTAEQENITADIIPGDDAHLKERIHKDHHYRNTLRDSFKDMIDRNYI